LAKEKKVVFAKIEPDVLTEEKEVIQQLLENQFKPERWSLHPTKTIVVDLRKSEEELLSAMEKDTRYSIRASQRRGVRVVKSVDLERFLTLYRQTAARQKFWIAEKELRLLWDIFSNEGKGFMLLAQWNKTDIAGCLILHYDRRAYYYHAASLRHLRELFAPYLLVWETMLQAKNLNLKELDLEGVLDPRIPSTSRWRGFSHFKKGFRGEEVELAGSFVKTYNPFAKLLFKFGNLSF
jgi:lipid II:glycine glycyltransferase (peptidoglycan interpeptide bridge formation enzyme)